MEKYLKKVFPKINFDLSKIIKMPWAVGRRAFLVILVIILLDIIYGGFLSYKYSIMAKGVGSSIDTVSLQFRKENYQKILDNWDARNKKIQEFLTQDYTDPF